MIEICENCKNCKRLRTEELLKDYEEEHYFSFMPPFELFLTDKVEGLYALLLRSKTRVALEFKGFLAFKLLPGAAT